MAYIPEDLKEETKTTVQVGQPRKDTERAVADTARRGARPHPDLGHPAARTGEIHACCSGHPTWVTLLTAARANEYRSKT